MLEKPVSSHAIEERVESSVLNGELGVTEQCGYLTRVMALAIEHGEHHWLQHAPPHSGEFGFHDGTVAEQGTDV